MDFSYSDEQRAIVELAAQIFADGTSQERLREIDAAPGPSFDRELWSQLAGAGLLGVAIPEAYGGAGLGFLEVASVVERVGGSAAPVPFLETVVLGVLPLVEFGSDAQKETWLPRVTRGKAILTASLMEAEGDASQLATTAFAKADGWRLRGSKFCVPAAEIADLLLVPAALGSEDAGVFLVDPRAAGVGIRPLDTTTGRPEAIVEFDDVRVAPGDLLGDPGHGVCIAEWIAERANAALACLALGACEAALRLTSEYAKTRKQFDQPIAMFQAVGHRAADAYIDVEGIRLTALQAAWRLSAGLPAAREVALAKHWACEAGQRVVHAAQHLHGGIGVDKEYPLHRFFLLVKQLELSLGGSTQQLRRLGALLAEEAR